MSKQAKRRQSRQPVGGQASPARSATSFTPVAVRARHDGWTPARQLAFVQALAGCGCIEEACAAVGMSPRAYYDLRARQDAGSFREAVDLALDVGIHRLADAMLGRALHGEVTPIFYKGEQVGEKRRYDNRLGMFLLRARAPERYGKWRDAMQQTRDHPDGAAIMLGQAIRNLVEDGDADTAGRARPQRAPLKPARLMDDPAEIAERATRMEREEEVRRRAEHERKHTQLGTYAQTLARQAGLAAAATGLPDDVA